MVTQPSYYLATWLKPSDRVVVSPVPNGSADQVIAESKANANRFVLDAKDLDGFLDDVGNRGFRVVRRPANLKGC